MTCESLPLSRLQPLSPVNDLTYCSEIQSMTRVAEEVRSLTTTQKANTVFENTDLIVFPDKHSGKFPLNGISESSFHEIREIFTRTTQGRHIWISDRILVYNIGDSHQYSPRNDDGYPYFMDLVLDSLKQLLIRPTGRKLVQKLEVYSKTTGRPIQIIQSMAGAPSMCSPEGLEIEYLVHLNSKASQIPYPLKEGGWGCHPTYCSLAHELIHVSHYFEDRQKMQRLLDAPAEHYTSLEERRTMTGSSGAGDDDAINESAICVEHGLSLRLDHRPLALIPMPGSSPRIEKWESMVSCWMIMQGRDASDAFFNILDGLEDKVMREQVLAIAVNNLDLTSNPKIITGLLVRSQECGNISMIHRFVEILIEKRGLDVKQFTYTHNEGRSGSSS